MMLNVWLQNILTTSAGYILLYINIIKTIYPSCKTRYKQPNYPQFSDFNLKNYINLFVLVTLCSAILYNFVIIIKYFIGSKWLK